MQLTDGNVNTKCDKYITKYPNKIKNQAWFHEDKLRTWKRGRARRDLSPVFSKFKYTRHIILGHAVA
jgi:hypothetical protein